MHLQRPTTVACKKQQRKERKKNSHHAYLGHDRELSVVQFANGSELNVHEFRAGAKVGGSNAITDMDLLSNAIIVVFKRSARDGVTVARRVRTLHLKKKRA